MSWVFGLSPGFCLSLWIDLILSRLSPKVYHWNCRVILSTLSQLIICFLSSTTFGMTLLKPYSPWCLSYTQPLRCDPFSHGYLLLYWLSPMLQPLTLNVLLFALSHISHPTLVDYLQNFGVSSQSKLHDSDIILAFKIQQNHYTYKTYSIWSQSSKDISDSNYEKRPFPIIFFTSFMKIILHRFQATHSSQIKLFSLLYVILS